MTVGDLVRARGRLAIQCAACGRFRYMDAGRYGPDEILADLGKRLQCMRCLSREVEARCVLPHAQTGRWPAEGS